MVEMGSGFGGRELAGLWVAFRLRFMAAPAAGIDVAVAGGAARGARLDVVELGAEPSSGSGDGITPSAATRTPRLPQSTHATASNEGGSPSSRATATSMGMCLDQRAKLRRSTPS